MDSEVLNWDYSTEQKSNEELKLELTTYLRTVYGSFEELHRNYNKNSTISKNAKSGMNLMEDVFGEFLINKDS